MAIPEAKLTPIEAIKATLPITEALERYAGAKLDGRPSRGKMQIRCPFHSDGNPSMTIYLNDNRCYCWTGNCIAHQHQNDVIDVVQMAEGVSRTEAVHILLKDLGITTTGRKTKEAVREAQRRSELDGKCRAALNKVRRLMDEMDFAIVDAFRKYDKPIDWGSDEMGDAVTDIYSNFFYKLQLTAFNLDAAEDENEKKHALLESERIIEEVNRIG